MPHVSLIRPLTILSGLPARFSRGRGAVAPVALAVAQ